MPSLLGASTNQPQVDPGTKVQAESRSRTIFGLSNRSGAEERRAAYDFYAWFFDHYLPRKFLHHYIYLQGKEYVLTEQEMVDCNPSIDLFTERKKESYVLRDLGSETRVAILQVQEEQLMAMIFGDTDPSPLLRSREKVVRLRDYQCAGGCYTNGTLGNFTVRLRNLRLTAKRNQFALLDTWRLDGEMSFYDEWDFDPKPFDQAASHRPSAAEVKVRFANATLPGHDFDITSAWVPFWLQPGDRRVQWAVNGRPVGDPKRVLDRFAIGLPVAVGADLVAQPLTTLAALMTFAAAL